MHSNSQFYTSCTLRPYLLACKLNISVFILYFEFSLLLQDSAVASLNLEIQLVSHNILRNQLLKTNIELRLCLQPTQALPKASSCPYGEFVLPMSTQNDGAISIRMLNKGGMFSSQSVLFTDFWPHVSYNINIILCYFLLL